jgi:hypothetical protein
MDAKDTLDTAAMLDVVLEAMKVERRRKLHEEQTKAYDVILRDYSGHEMPFVQQTSKLHKAPQRGCEPLISSEAPTAYDIWMCDMCHKSSHLSRYDDWVGKRFFCSVCNIRCISKF